MIVSGKKIIQLREKKKFSQQELSELVGVSQSVVSVWESDQSQPHIKHLDILAAALGVKVNDLLEDTPVSIYHQHGENDHSINGNTVYAENQKLTEELVNTQRKLIASLEASNIAKDKQIEELKNSRF
jgi:transcriptional regulator with XRE-family HTH domain